MDYAQLRGLLEPLVTALKDAGTHTMLPTLCEELGLPAPAADGSKRERMVASFEAVADTDLPAVARKLLMRHPPNATTRNHIQDILWSDSACPPIPKRYRREVARRLNSEDLYGDARKFDDLLEQLWILDADDWLHLLGGKPTGLRAEIQQHVHRNPEDWPAETLFDQLGAYEASDRRFALFLEGLASADVRPDEAAQRHVVGCINEPLRSCGIELRETRLGRWLSGLFIGLAARGEQRSAEESHLRLARKARPPAPRRAEQRHRDRHQRGQGARL